MATKSFHHTYFNIPMRVLIDFNEVKKNRSSLVPPVRILLLLHVKEHRKEPELGSQSKDDD